MHAIGDLRAVESGRIGIRELRPVYWSWRLSADTLATLRPLSSDARCACAFLGRVFHAPLANWRTVRCHCRCCCCYLLTGLIDAMESSKDYPLESVMNWPCDRRRLAFSCKVRETSISRSGLTFDCVQDFFSKAVGHVKKALLSYGPNGRSRGEATIIFSKPDSAAKAQKEYNGVGVDGKPMRVRNP